jgi:hypothetical protein
MCPCAIRMRARQGTAARYHRVSYRRTAAGWQISECMAKPVISQAIAYCGMRA